MKKLFAILGLWVFGSLGLFAQTNPVPISALTNAGSLTGAEIIPIVQSGHTRRTTVEGIAVYSTNRAIRAETLVGTLPGATFPAVLPAVDGSQLTGIGGSGSGETFWQTNAAMANSILTTNTQVIVTNANDGSFANLFTAGLTLGNATGNAALGYAGANTLMFSSSSNFVSGDMATAGTFFGDGSGLTGVAGSVPAWLSNTNELYLRPNAAITNITSFGALATSLSVGDYGWTFRVARPIKVTSLGLWHNAGMSNSYTLYLRRTNNCTVLGQVNHFPPAGTVETNRFHYSMLDFPVTLTTNETYEIALYNPSGGTGPVFAESTAQFGGEILPELGTAPSVTCLGFSGWPSNVLGIVTFLYSIGGEDPDTANPFTVNPTGLQRNSTTPGSSMTSETIDFRLPIRASLEAAHNGPPYDTGFLFNRRPMRDIVGFLDNYPNPYGETYVRGAVEFMKSNNFLAAGWGMVSLNDYWTTNRDANGVLVPRPDYFTNDIPFLANFCHTNGFRFGIYTSWNTNASNNGIGSPYSYLSNDVYHFVKWGADSLMYDNSFTPGFYYADEVKRSVRIINDASLIYQNRTGNTNRGIELRMGANLGSLADQHWTNNIMTWECVQGVNAYTIIGDENNSMDRALRKMRGAFSGPWFVRPGHAYDVQAIPNGNPKEFLRSMFNLYAIGPMAMATGFQLITNASTMDLFTNAVFWSFYDDSAWIPGGPVYSNNLTEVWTRPIGGRNSGTNLVCLVNANSTSATNITFTNSYFGQPAARQMVLFDPWHGTNTMITTGTVTYSVPETNAILFVVYPLVTNNWFGSLIGQQFPPTKAVATNYTASVTDAVLFCTGTNQLITLPNCTNTATPAGLMLTVVVATTTGSAIVTNANGVQTVLGDLKVHINSTNRLTVINDGTKWW
jgi:hypothetical protein